MLILHSIPVCLQYFKWHFSKQGKQLGFSQFVLHCSTPFYTKLFINDTGEKYF